MSDSDRPLYHHHTDYPPDYDPLQMSNYNPSFTADISNRMRIPDRLSVGQSGDFPNHVSDNDELIRLIQESAQNMQVPDRILLAGSDHHIGLKESSRTSLHLDFPTDSLSTHQYVGLETPPRVLKFDNITSDETHDDSLLDSSVVIVPNGYANFDNAMDISGSMTPPLSMPFTPGMTASDVLLGQGDDDNLLLRRQVMRLTRHVVHLQNENQKRSNREMVVYPLIVSYIFFQFARWFFSSRKY